MTTLDRFQACIQHYHNALVNALERNGLVPEFIADAPEHQRAPRLLCQTRGIIYLCHMHELHHTPLALSRATELYQRIRPAYLRAVDGHYAPTRTETGGARYELAFLLHAQIKLAHNTAVDGLAEDIQETLKEILSSPIERWLAPREDGDFLELNALMHLFEALTLAHRHKPSEHTATYIAQITHVVATQFLHPDDGLLAERISQEGTVLEYDLGHVYEWGSLLMLNQDQALDLANLDPQRFLELAEAISRTTFNGGMISNRLDEKRQPMALDSRIWVNLERLRALVLSGMEETDTLLAATLDNYFPHRLPEEYLGQQGPIKSTTGYHVIECYRAFTIKKPSQSQSAM